MKDEFFYRKLNVYQKAVDLVAGIYKLLKIFPPEERYALCDQIRRASVSVPSNIAEGMSRVSDKEKNSFFRNKYRFLDGNNVSNRDCKEVRVCLARGF